MNVILPKDISPSRRRGDGGGLDSPRAGAHRKPLGRRVVNESRDDRRLFHVPSEDALRAAFAERNMDRERSERLYSYNPLTADLS